ncbi:MAG TPA: ribosome small subunit-dependent GTPase A [Woeseiaceae bacterium]
MQQHHNLKARVVATFGRRLDLCFADCSEATGRVKGRRLQPVCGDYVLAERLSNEPEWLITEIVERRNELGRPNRQGKVDILAANIDLVVVVTAELPVPDWFIVDRYLCAAELMRAAGAIVFNKTDLGEAAPAILDSMDTYRKAGYPTLHCSAVSGSGMDDLRALIEERTAVFVGQSGVGKSTLINALFGDDSLTTAPVSRKRQEGRHTTVNSKMRTLASGGHVIDSPGVRDYAPAITAPEEVAQAFPELREAAPECRFANCRHLQEPGCKVIEAVAAGTIAARRYESYRRLYRMSLDFQRKAQ